MKPFTESDYREYFEHIVAHLLKTYKCKIVYPRNPANRYDMQDGIELYFPDTDFHYHLSNFLLYSVIPAHTSLIFQRCAKDIENLIDTAFLKQIKK